jgi:hypothetical protein
MTVWRTIPVEEQPTLTLEQWRVFDTTDGWHFVGYCIENVEGRVSSAVEAFDPAKACGITRTSRVYRLTGRPGHDADAMYVWNVWARRNNEMAAKDATDEVWAAIQKQHPSCA